VRKPSDEQIAEWYTRLFRTALRMTGHTEDAADLAQQTFYQALNRWDQFNDRSSPTTWLHRILINCVRDWARRRGIRSSDPIDNWALVPVDSGQVQASDLLERKEQLAYLREVIENMSETLRPAFVATVLDGYTYQEASEILGIPVGTIASRVHEARRQIEAVMHQRFPED